MIKNKKKVQKAVLQPIHSNWSSFPARRGVYAKKVDASMYVPEFLVTSAERSHLWREIATRSGLEKRIDAYFEPSSLNYCNSTLEECFNRVENMVFDHIQPGSLSVRTFSNAWKALQHATSSGYPWYSKKGLVREKAFRHHVRQLKHLESGRKITDLQVFPCSMSARVTIREKPDNKPRLIWVYPVTQLVNESKFASVLIEAFKEFKHFGWAFNWLDNGKGFEKLNRLIVGGKFAYSADFSSYDASVSSYLIRRSFNILKRLFKMTDVEKRLWQSIVEYFIHTPLITHHGTLQKHRGIPSGSYFTQLIGCIVNLVSIEYFHLRQGWPDFVRTSTNVLGDDSLTVWTSEVYSRNFAERFKTCAAELGLTVHPEKSKLSIFTTGNEENEISYLGKTLRQHPPYFLYDRDEVIARIVYPETNDRCPQDTYLRVCGLTWTYGTDPKLYKILKYVENHLVTKYPWCRELAHNARDPEVARWFKFVFDEAGIDISVFPDILELRKRYIGRY